MIFEIQVQFNESTNASQTLTLDGVRFQLTTYTNKVSQKWMLDIADEEGNVIIAGLSLVTGLDLLYPYRHLAVPAGILFVNDQTQDTLEDPPLDGFAKRDFALYYQEAEG